MTETLAAPRQSMPPDQVVQAAAREGLDEREPA